METQGNIFSNICSQLNTSPKIDLFATRLNTQLSTFVSYRPDPKCIVVNAFLLDSWASGTRKQYKIYFKQWTTFCKTQPVDISSASIKDGTEFLLSLYKKGLGYSAINTARSMLSNILPVKEGIEWQTSNSNQNVERNLQNKTSTTMIYLHI